jgi:hypothetical protein
MGLLNDFPDDLLRLIRNAAQNSNPNANSGAGDANDLPSWVPRQQQRLPLSFAGPVLTPDITASSPSRPGTTVPQPGPADASAVTDLSWLPVNWSADPRRAQPPAPPTQNLTTQALRMKGVPEADIAAATGNPELMKQLIIQHYGPSSAGAPARTGSAPDGSSAGGGSFGDSRQPVHPEISGLDDFRARHDAPARGRFMSGDPTGFSVGDGNLYRADAANSVRLNGPSGLFFGPGYTGDPAPKPGPTPAAQPTLPTQIAAGGPRCDGYPAGCHDGGSYGTSGLYSVKNRNLCESCAVRALRIQDLGSVEKTKILEPYIR